MNAPFRQPDDAAPYENMGPSLLSKQPPTLRDEPTGLDQNWQIMFRHLESQMGAMRAWRWAWWAHWAVLARFFVPFRYVWLVVANKMWRGSPLNDSIIDSTGQLAVRTCRGGMWTGLTSPSRPWFKMGIGLPWVKLDGDGKEWLEDTEQKVATVLAQSNFYDQMAQVDEDEIVFGTSPLLCYEDSEDVARFTVACAGEYYLDVGARLSCDTYAREFTYNVKQIVEFATLEKCPQMVRELWRQGGASWTREFIVGHMIQPNNGLDPGDGTRRKSYLVPSQFVWREVYWLKGIATPRPLSSRGFYTQPFAAFMWKRVSNDPYGRSPCMDALGDNKQIQMMTIRSNEYLEKGVRPPMGADVALKNEPASIMPAMITYMNTEGGKKGFWPLFDVDPRWFDAICKAIVPVQARVDKCLFVNLFMAISQMEGVQPRNELELTKRDLERLQELGPVISLNEGALDIIIRRVLSILERRRMLKPMPESLKNIPLKITYVSILRLAQKSAEAVAMKDGFTTAITLSTAAKNAGLPDPLRVINLDKAMRHYLEATNFNNGSIFTEDEVKAHDDIRAKAQQQAQIPGQAMAAAQGAKVLSQASLSPDNALGAIVGR